MDVNVIPSLKRQRVLLYNAETGEGQDCPEYSLANEDQFSINCLELWQSVGFKKVPDVDENYLAYSRRLKIDSSEADGSSVLQKSIGDVQKAVVELSQIVQLTSLLKSNEYLTLQTCFQAEIQDRGLPLPVLQTIQILKDSVHRSKQRIDSGLNSSRVLVQKRRIFADSLVELRKHWRMVYVDKNLNRLPTIDWTSSDQSVAIDCSVIPGDKLSPSLGSQLVPLTVTLDGIVVADSERQQASDTLHLTLCLHRPGGSSTPVSTVSAWDVDGPLQKSLEILSSGDSTLMSHVSQVHAYCVRRRHSALFWSIFSRMRRDCIDSSDCWVNHAESDGGTAGPDKECTGQLLEEVLRSDKLIRSLKVVNCSDRSFTVMVSQTLSLTLSMESLKDTSGAAAITKDRTNDWLREVLTSVILQSQSRLLASLVDVTEKKAECESNAGPDLREVEDILIAKNSSVRQAQTKELAAATAAAAAKAMNPINRPLGASSAVVPASASSSAAGSGVKTPEVNVSLRAALQLVRSRINYKRAYDTLSNVIDNARKWNVFVSNSTNLCIDVAPFTEERSKALCERWQFTLNLSECRLTVTLNSEWNYFAALSCASSTTSDVGLTVTAVDPSVFVPASSLSSTSVMSSFCRPLNGLAIANANDLQTVVSSQILGSHVSDLLQKSVAKVGKRLRLTQWSPLTYSVQSGAQTVAFWNVFLTENRMHIEASYAAVKDRQTCSKLAKDLKISTVSVSQLNSGHSSDCVGACRWTSTGSLVGHSPEDLAFLSDSSCCIVLVLDQPGDESKLFDSLVSAISV